MRVIPTEEAVPRLAEALAYYEAEDVCRWFQRGVEIVGHAPQVTEKTIEDVRTFQKVPNEVFREEFIRQDLGGELVTGLRKDEPAWISLFRDELQRARSAPEGLDSCTKKIGPGKLTAHEVASYLRRVLGIKPSSGGESLAWLIDYELAAVLCKTMGMTPVLAGV